MKKIMFVDDEQNVLKSLRRLFFDSDYETVFFDNPKDALLKIQSDPPHMVISDMRMPEMDGYELLKKISQTHPSIIRIILSGYAEKNTILKAINDGTARAYITKPWNNQDLLKRIQHYFAIFDILNNAKLMEVVESIGELPVLPKMYTRIIHLIQNGNDINDITKCIELEPTYVAKLLAIVNSSFYGVNIGTVKQAIVYLGLETVKNVILSSEIFDRSRYDSVLEKYIQALWVHSNLVDRVFNKVYSRITNEKVPENIGACGLLHDIGHLMLPVYFTKKFMEVNPSLEKPVNISNDQEMNIFNINHSILGAMLLDWWNLPSSMVELCLFHHSPLDSRICNHHIVALLHLVDHYAWELNCHSPSDVQPVEEIFKIANVSIDAIKSELEKSIKEIEEMNKIVL